jgi:hypothetical protein
MQKFKRRKCRLCEKLALQNKNICYQHFLEANRKKREDKLAKQAMSKEKKKARFEQGETYRKRLFKKAWKSFSEAIRWVNHDDGSFKLICYTCGKMLEPKEAHAGHFPRFRHHRRRR